ncbi:MAG: 2-oxoglutarate dehydrogenase E1 component [Pseudomonadota bacterium]
MLARNKSVMQHFADNSYLFGGNAPFIEDLYGRYLQNPSAVPDEWRRYFDQIQAQYAGAPDVDHQLIQHQVAEAARHNAPVVGGRQDYAKTLGTTEAKQLAVLQLINAHRVRGHENADVDPLKLNTAQPVPDLEPSFHGLTENDMEMVFHTGSFFGPKKAPLRTIIALLKQTYCGHIGAEYMHIGDTAQKRWLQERLETIGSTPRFTSEYRRHLLQRIAAAEGLEKYIHTKYVGQKRFSLEGGEATIPLIDEIIQRAGARGVQEVVLGMAHRGRLNMLVNVFGKSPRVLFKEFEGSHDAKTKLGSGDVKYHQGFSCDIKTSRGPIHVTLAFNPSHLEIVGPVVQGSVRARQKRRHDIRGYEVVPIVLHGDAAFAGQGVVMETLNMSKARGYGTGGTLHVVINNQIGFTTSNPLDARSTYYCTEVARTIQAPILHVNGDDPEAVMLAAQILFDYRMEFHNDVVLDLVCYRRHGHNEADEPTVTQPLMYKKIRALPTLLTAYSQHLVNDGVINATDADDVKAAYRQDLERGEPVAYNILPKVSSALLTDWAPFLDTPWQYPVKTGVAKEICRQLGVSAAHVPPGFEMHPQVAKIYENRLKMCNGELAFDWGGAEILAYASLLREGFAVRLSGQDSGRGTFFHRHATVHCQSTGTVYVPLKHIAQDQPSFSVIDSLLSEEAVLAFEYGYASANPKSLTIWEAQFGDFANGAQVVIDQFISSGEAKWGRLCGLVMMLPHGYDGQGPEHSSARTERYLQLCAEENMQVVMPSLPAQMFHVLRRQMVRPYRKPLIIMTPKNLLRHRDSVSTLSEIIDGSFQNIIGEVTPINTKAVTRVILCSGKIYFELALARQELKRNDVAIVRVEQLYPLDEPALQAELSRYAPHVKLIWCQEEPQNQGPWQFLERHMRPLLGARAPAYAGRPAAASPAVGYSSVHSQQQKALIDAAFNL